MGLMDNAVALASGAVFGFALDKGKTNVPFVVSEQMEMNNFIMMRMFLAASATSAGALLVSHTLGFTKREARSSIALGFGKLGGYGGNLLGGVLLGSGMYLTGSCPGTVWAQLPLGATAATSISLLAGGLVGTIIYGYQEKNVRTCVPSYQSRGTVEHADLVPQRVPYAVATVGFIGAIALLMQAVNSFIPWQSEVAKVIHEFSPNDLSANPLALDAVAWDPAFAGMVVGMLQFPMHLSTAGALGMSSGWVLLASNLANLFDGNLEKNAPYLHNNLRNSHAAFQLITALGVIFGTMLSQELSGYPNVTEVAFAGANIGGRGLAGHLTAFVGGAIMLIGARVQAGCTSGHGLSGLSTLSLASLVSVCGMFAGGMSTAFVNTVVFGN